MLLRVFLLLVCLNSSVLIAQKNPQLEFWNTLSLHCGKSYEGKLITTPEPKDFKDKLLTIHFFQCTDSVIRVPLVVGDNRSRTWVFTLLEEGIQLKHDHRHEDGSEDKVTQYGGATSNTGFDNLQYFPADQETANLIPYAAGNIWWVTVNDSTLTYNLRRINSDKPISIEFDLTKQVDAPKAPWGWESN